MNRRKKKFSGHIIIDSVRISRPLKKQKSLTELKGSSIVDPGRLVTFGEIQIFRYNPKKPVLYPKGKSKCRIF